MHSSAIGLHREECRLSGPLMLLLFIHCKSLSPSYPSRLTDMLLVLLLFYYSASAPLLPAVVMAWLMYGMLKTKNDCASFTSIQPALQLLHLVPMVRTSFTNGCCLNRFIRCLLGDCCLLYVRRGRKRVRIFLCTSSLKLIARLRSHPADAIIIRRPSEAEVKPKQKA